VLTVRRAIAMVGLDGVRHAASALRSWPGPLPQVAADELSAQIERAKRAGRVAQALRPAGYDAEVVYLVTLLQNLGRLLAHYHFPEEAAQVRRLMLPAPAASAGTPDEPGMTEEAAAFAVLGTDIESMGAAVARHWGLDESVLHMIRRLPAATPVRAIERDDDLLRALASAANEAVDAAALPPKQAAAALERVAQRYARPLALSLKDIQDALQGLPLRAETAPRGEPTLTGSEP
jgi:non-specific serine/threonine protein kinase